MDFAEMQFILNCFTIILHKALTSHSIYETSVVYLSGQGMIVCLAILATLGLLLYSYE